MFGIRSIRKNVKCGHFSHSRNLLQNIDQRVIAVGFCIWANIAEVGGGGEESVVSIIKLNR
jgi:hypothetical protein